MKDLALARTRSRVLRRAGIYVVAVVLAVPISLNGLIADAR